MTFEQHMNDLSSTFGLILLVIGIVGGGFAICWLAVSISRMGNEWAKRSRELGLRALFTAIALFLTLLPVNKCASLGSIENHNVVHETGQMFLVMVGVGVFVSLVTFITYLVRNGQRIAYVYAR
jgi:hypothetical protein